MERIMLTVMRAPSRYVQGVDAILSLDVHAAALGQKFFVVADGFVMNMTRDKLLQGMQGDQNKLRFEEFNGQCTMSEVRRLQELLEQSGCDAIVGVGGGRTFDTVKAVAYFANIPVIIVPTIAATDAPCTALSVMYNDDGSFSEYLFYPKNPDLVLVDSALVAKAPVRFLVAGMGDALGTYFEARTCLNSKSLNLVGGAVSQAGFALSKLCYETLKDYGFKAKLAAEQGVVTPAFEKVLEAATYLSGVGAENGGLAAAHSIYNGFTVLEACEKTMHGEIVAFGTLVQLILEDSPIEEIEDVIDFCLSVGLPINLEQIGLARFDAAEIMKVAEAACKEGETIHNTLGGVTVTEVYNAILTADNMGKRYLQQL
ncbi:glycerol dehydrogenase [Shewanella sp. NFH-SH190041]|nr:glycerol dehydrogenase [Shewanella sp. NFH-SH190041]